MPNGIDCCTNQTMAFCIATTHFDWMGLKCHILQIVTWAKLYFLSLVTWHANMSHVTCM